MFPGNTELEVEAGFLRSGRRFISRKEEISKEGDRILVY